MCRSISGEAVLKDGERIKVYTSKVTDSHAEIRAEYNIREDDCGPAGARHTPVELIPVTSLTDVEGMKFNFDAWCPDWWTDDMTESAIRQLYQAAKKRWKGKTLKFDGDLNLGSLTSMPEGVTLEAGGSLNLGSLTSLPEGVTVSARKINFKDKVAVQ